MLVEEIPKARNVGNSTVYFSSSINLTARPSHSSKNQNDNTKNNSVRNSKSRPKVNYNVNQLMYAQTQANEIQKQEGPLKSSQQIQLERIISKRLNELSKETTVTTFELPKFFSYNSSNTHGQHKKAKLGNTPATKKILSARRNLNLYFEEEKNLFSINSILNTNYQFIEPPNTSEPSKKIQKTSGKPFKPRLKLCCICGSNSDYSRCYNCGLFYCSVRCHRAHEELRCN